MRNRPEATFWLIVEDNERDHLPFRSACRGVSNCPVFLRLPNAEEAQSFLSQTSLKVTAIVSELHLQGEGGWALLQFVKGQERLSTTPFFVLSYSGGEDDVRRTLELGAEDYRVKPRDKGMLARIVEVWVARCSEPVCQDSTALTSTLVPVSFGAIGGPAGPNVSKAV